MTATRKSSEQSVQRVRLLFRDIVFRSRRIAASRLGNVDLTMTEMLTLAVIEHHDRIVVGDLARELGVARATMSRVLGKLERGKYVRRTVDRTDRRRTNVRITLKGRRLRQRVGGFWSEMGRKMFEGLTADQMQRLEGDLLRIYENVLSVQKTMERGS